MVWILAIRSPVLLLLSLFLESRNPKRSLGRSHGLNAFPATAHISIDLCRAGKASVRTEAGPQEIIGLCRRGLIFGMN